MNVSAMMMPSGVKAIGIPSGSSSPPTQPFFAYTDVSAMPATAVGNAKGRSTMASISRRPGIGYRTSTQATSTPKTTFNDAANADALIVRRYDASARGVVTMPQNCPGVSVAVLMNTPQSGMRTSRDRYSTVSPSVGPKPGSAFRRTL